MCPVWILGVKWLIIVVTLFSIIFEQAFIALYLCAHCSLIVGISFCIDSFVLWGSYITACPITMIFLLLDDNFTFLTIILIVLLHIRLLTEVKTFPHFSLYNSRVYRTCVVSKFQWKKLICDGILLILSFCWSSAKSWRQGSLYTKYGFWSEL